MAFIRYFPRDNTLFTVVIIGSYIWAMDLTMQSFMLFLDPFETWMGFVYTHRVAVYVIHTTTPHHSG